MHYRFLVRSLRNATAHNNCLFANLRSGTSLSPQVLSTAVSQLGTIKPSQRHKKQLTLTQKYI